MCRKFRRVLLQLHAVRNYFDLSQTQGLQALGFRRAAGHNLGNAAKQPAVDQPEPSRAPVSGQRLTDNAA